MQCRRSCFVPGRYKFCRHRMCLHLISHLEPVRSSSQDYLILFTTRSRCIPKPAKLFFAKRPSMEYAHQLNVNTFFFFVRREAGINYFHRPYVPHARPPCTRKVHKTSLTRSRQAFPPDVRRSLGGPRPIGRWSLPSSTRSFPCPCC